MTNRRDFVAAAATALPLAAATSAGAAEKNDYYEKFLDVIRAWQKHDIDGVIAKMDENVVWYAFVGAPPVVGRAAMRKYLEGIAGKRKREDWRIFHYAVSGERLFVEGVDDFTNDQDVRIAVPYAGVVEYKNGLVTGWRDYFDAGLLTKMKEGGGVPAAIQPLVDRKGEP